MPFFRTQMLGNMPDDYVVGVYDCIENIVEQSENHCHWFLSSISLTNVPFRLPGFGALSITCDLEKDAHGVWMQRMIFILGRYACCHLSRRSSSCLGHQGS